MLYRKAAQTKIHSTPALRGRNSKRSVGAAASLSALFGVTTCAHPQRCVLLLSNLRGAKRERRIPEISRPDDLRGLSPAQ
jgi:hypothetical protein